MQFSWKKNPKYLEPSLWLPICTFLIMVGGFKLTFTFKIHLGLLNYFYITKPLAKVDNTISIWYSKSQFDLWKLKAYDWYGFYTFCSITWLGILNTMNFTTKNLPLSKITDYNASSKNKNVSSKSLSYLRSHSYSNLNSVKVSFYTKKGQK